MRLIDADALIEKWYEVNDIGPEDIQEIKKDWRLP